MTYGGSLVALVRPFYGFLIYVCFSIIRPESLWHWSVPQGNYSRIIALSFLIGWAINGFGNWNLGGARRPAIMLAMFWIWSLLSTLFCEQPEVGLGFLESMGKIVLPAIAGLTLINSRRDVYALAWTIAGSIGYVAYDLNNSYFSGFNRLSFEGFGGMDNNSWTIGLVAGVGFSFFLGLSEKIWWRRYLAFAFAAFLTHAVFFSFSRGGMLGLVVVGLASAWLIPKSSKNIALMAFGVCVALAMAGPEVVERFSSINKSSLAGADAEEVDASAESRVELWGICLQMTAESPLFGKGPNHFPLFVHLYDVKGTAGMGYKQGKEAHTLWLQIAAELGIPGVMFLFLYYVLTVKGLYRYSRLDRTDSQGLTPGATARMVIAALVGFIVSAQFVSLEGLEIPYYIAIVGLGSLKLATTTEVVESQRKAGNGDLFESDKPTEPRTQPFVGRPVSVA